MGGGVLIIYVMEFSERVLTTGEWICPHCGQRLHWYSDWMGDEIGFDVPDAVAHLLWCPDCQAEFYFIDMPDGSGTYVYDLADGLDDDDVPIVEPAIEEGDEW